MKVRSEKKSQTEHIPRQLAPLVRRLSQQPMLFWTLIYVPILTVCILLNWHFVIAPWTNLGQLMSYQYSEKALPPQVRGKVRLVCGVSKGVFRYDAGRLGGITSLPFTIQNEGDEALVLNDSVGKYRIQLRPRVLDLESQRVLLDGITPGYLDRAIIMPGAVFNAAIQAPSLGFEKLRSFEGAFLEYDLVQEGVAWFGVGAKCRIPVVSGDFP